MGETLSDALVGILEGVFPYKTYRQDIQCVTPSFKEGTPVFQLGRRSGLYPHFLQADGIEPLTEHVEGNLID